MVRNALHSAPRANLVFTALKFCLEWLDSVVVDQAFRLIGVLLAEQFER